MLKYYGNWIDVANEFWQLGMKDKHPLQRHRAVFDLIADHAASKPSEVDYDYTVLTIEFAGKAYPDRKIKFVFGRFHGKAEITATVTDAPIPTRVTPAEVETAFAWLNEEKPKAGKSRVRKPKSVEVAA